MSDAKTELNAIRETLEECDWLNEDEPLVASVAALCAARNALAKELARLKAAREPRKIQKVALRDPKSADRSCDCFKGHRRCGKKPAGWFSLEGWPDALMLCEACEVDCDHDHETVGDILLAADWDVAPTPQEAVTKLIAEVERLRKGAAAIRVLDAWAKKHKVRVPSPEYVTRVDDGCGTDRRWLIRLPWRYWIIRLESPSACRIAAADALAKEDPSLLEGVE